MGCCLFSMSLAIIFCRTKINIYKFFHQWSIKWKPEITLFIKMAMPESLKWSCHLKITELILEATAKSYFHQTFFFFSSIYYFLMKNQNQSFALCKKSLVCYRHCFLKSWVTLGIILVQMHAFCCSVLGMKLCSNLPEHSPDDWSREWLGQSARALKNVLIFVPKKNKCFTSCKLLSWLLLGFWSMYLFLFSLYQLILERKDS